MTVLCYPEPGRKCCVETSFEALPKNDEAFPERLKDLQKAFRQHSRDEKRELLPAVQRALSDEQLQRVTEKWRLGSLKPNGPGMMNRKPTAQLPGRNESKPNGRPSRGIDCAAGIRRRLPPNGRGGPDRRRYRNGRWDQRGQDRGNNLYYRTARDRYKTETVASELREAADLPGTAADSVADIRSTWVEFLGQATIAGTQISQKVFWPAAERQQQLAAETICGWMDRNLIRFTVNCAEQNFRPFGSHSAAGGHERPDQQLW
jgi:hypothetical protein